MPGQQPTAGDVHINTPLTNISTAYLQSLDYFVADKMFPIVKVQKKSDAYYTYPKDQWFRTDAKERGPSEESAGSGYEVSSDSYACKRYALHKDIDDEVRANSDNPLDPDRDGTEFVMRQLVLKRELLWSAAHFTTSTWTGSSTGGDITPTTKWDASGGKPIAELRAQIFAMKTKTGFRPNKLFLPDIVWTALQDTADFLDRLKTTSDKIVTADLIARILEIEEVVIGRAVQNTAAEGATPVMAEVYGDDALLLYVPKSAGILTPSAGYTFSWTGFLGAGAQGQRMKKFRMEKLTSDRVEGEMFFDHKLVASDLGVFFDDVLT